LFDGRKPAVPQLAPDLDHANLDAMLIPGTVPSPDRLDELAAGVVELGSLDECIQQVEVGAGERHGCPCQVDLP